MGNAYTKHKIRVLASLLGVALAVTVGGYWLFASQTGNKVTLKPHRALYAIELAAIRNTTSIANVRGTMFYEWRDSCDGWNVDQKFNLEFLYPEADTVNMDSTYSTFESKDGRRFHFSNRRERNGQPHEKILGDANGGILGGAGVAHFNEPANLSLPLPNGTLFPTAHTIALLKMALQGQHWQSSPLFDGSESEPAVDVHSFVGKALPGDSDAEKLSPLLKTPAWRVRMAFFPGIMPKSDAPVKSPENAENIDDEGKLATEAELPDYEMSMILHANGVVREYVIDYPEFSVRATLQALDELPTETCQ